MEDDSKKGTETLKRGLAQMLKGGVIMDVTTAEQAKIAEDAGATSVMALERVPYDIRMDGGIARTAAVGKIRDIMEAVSIPVMAKARIGHYGEALILQELGVDYIDESEVLSPADTLYHIDKRRFIVPFVCGARSLEEALRRIREGAAMIRTKGEPGTGDVKEAVTHMRVMRSDIALAIGYELGEQHYARNNNPVKRDLSSKLEKKLNELEAKQLANLVGIVLLGNHYEGLGLLNMDMELMAKLREYGISVSYLDGIKELGQGMFGFGKGYNEISLEKLATAWGVEEDSIKETAGRLALPVVNFAAGGIATAADAAHMMYLGSDGIFVGSGIFKSDNPAKAAAAIVKATTQYKDVKLLSEAQAEMSEVKAMKGIAQVNAEDRMQDRSS